MDSSGPGSLRDLAKGSGISGAGRVAGAGMMFLIHVLLVRTFSPSGYGTFVLAWTIAVVGSGVACFGTNVSLAQLLGRYVGEGDWSSAKGVILTTTAFTVGGSLLVCGLGLLLSPMLAEAIFSSDVSSSTVMLAAGLIPLVALQQLGSAVLRGFRDMRFLALHKQIVTTGGELVVAIMALSAGLNVFSVLVLYGVVHIVAILAALALVSRIRSPVILRWRSLKGRLAFREVWDLSWPLALSQQLSLLKNRGDVLLIGYLASPATVGLYNAVFKIAQALQIPLSAVNSILMPSLAGLFASGREKQMQKIYSAGSRWGFYMALPAFLVLAFQSDLVLGLAYGEPYSAAGTALVILAGGFLLNSSTGSFGESLIAVGQTRVNAVIAFLSLVSNLGLNILLVPRLGVLGASLAAAGSLTVACLVGWPYVLLRYSLQPYGRQHICVGLSSLAGAGLAFLAGNVLLDSPALELAVTGFACYGSGLAGLAFTGCATEEEQRFLNGAWGWVAVAGRGSGHGAGSGR